MNYIEIIGYCGGGILTLNLIPQIYKTWLTKSANDLSFLFLFFSLIGFGLYFVYGIFNNLYTIIIPCSISFFFMCILIILKYKYDKKLTNPPSPKDQSGETSRDYNSIDKK